jgi:hypothetical protein
LSGTNWQNLTLPRGCADEWLTVHALSVNAVWVGGTSDVYYYSGSGLWSTNFAPVSFITRGIWSNDAVDGTIFVGNDVGGSAKVYVGGIAGFTEEQTTTRETFTSVWATSPTDNYYVGGWGV